MSFKFDATNTKFLVQENEVQFYLSVVNSDIVDAAGVISVVYSQPAVTNPVYIQCTGPPGKTYFTVYHSYCMSVSFTNKLVKLEILSPGQRLWGNNMTC